MNWYHPKINSLFKKIYLNVESKSFIFLINFSLCKIIVDIKLNRNVKILYFNIK